MRDFMNVLLVVSDRRYPSPHGLTLYNMQVRQSEGEYQIGDVYARSCTTMRT